MSSNLIARSNFPAITAWVRRLAAAGVCALMAASAAQAAWVPLDFPRRDVTLRAAATDGARIAVSGSKGTFGVSDDGGKTWRLAAMPEGERFDFRGLALTGPKSAVLMSAGDGPEGRARLYRTTDDGATWALAYETTLAGAFFDTIAFRDARRGFVMGDPIDGKWFLLSTQDGGATWTRLAPEMPALEPGEAAFAASNSALFLGPSATAWMMSGGLARGRVFRSGDDGRTWQAADSPIAGGLTAGLFGGLAIDKRRVVVVGGDYKDETRAGHDIAVSNDAGKTWAAVGNAGVLLEGVGRLDQSTLIAVGPRGTAISRDLGRTWTLSDSEAFHAIACAPVGKTGGRCVAAGANGRVAVWRD